MQKNVCYHTAIYLRLSRDDEDIDGSAKRESDSISSNVSCTFLCKRTAGYGVIRYLYRRRIFGSQL